MVEVAGVYSTVIGNLAFEAPDACASAMEIARREPRAQSSKASSRSSRKGGATACGKDLALPAEAEGWAEVHRALTAAKLGVRRPHPRLIAADPGGRLPGGIAVRRLGRRRRPGLIARPVGIGQPKRDSSGKRQLAAGSTP
ncbi:hypothetical protein J2R78_001735 [Bradyrhizobium sp. USDA 4538]|nr:hypothetical protein [Bradyrhizobium sp. USDA 4538]MCP1899334.1 hypothetical protein [Bradyrhizobium sp. USDA 4537]MCP1986554.1 hypothetical protein [Bradyrhizobium sp. USDA 4539]